MTNEAAAVCAYDLRRFLLSRLRRYHGILHLKCLTRQKSSLHEPTSPISRHCLPPPYSPGASHAVARWTEFVIAIVASDRDCKKQRIYRGCPRFIELFPSYQFYGEFGIDFPATEMRFVIITGKYEIDWAIIHLKKNLPFLPISYNFLSNFSLAVLAVLIIN